MENQINMGDQNTQQLGQNPISQPVQIPEKPKVNYWMISTILLLVIFLITGSWFIWNSNSTNSKSKISSDQQQPNVNQTNQMEAMGVVRSSGLSEGENKKFGLITVNFQITDFGDYQKAYQDGQTQGYYLISNNVNDELLGKCVRVVGTIPEEWKNINKADTYNRSALNVTKIEKIDNSNCNPYLQSLPTVDNAQEKLILRGTVVHGKRPAPDIGYDYQLKLVEPFVDKFSSAGSPQKVSLVDAIPSTNSLWNELENNINKEIGIEGYMVWGYAESKYFQIISVKATNNDEETEVKSLITKFEKYIQDRNVNGLMSLFTPATTKEEIASYHNLMGQDPDVGAPRLFNNVTSNFIIINWKIARRKYPDNKELIAKDNNKYFVTVDETRKSWCNADPCAGTYSFENTSPYIFEIANVNSQWIVDKYYLMNQGNTRNGGPKYEALMF